MPEGAPIEVNVDPCTNNPYSRFGFVLDKYGARPSSVTVTAARACVLRTLDTKRIDDKTVPVIDQKTHRNLGSPTNNKRISVASCATSPVYRTSLLPELVLEGPIWNPETGVVTYIEGNTHPPDTGHTQPAFAAFDIGFHMFRDGISEGPDGLAVHETILIGNQPTEIDTKS